LFVIIEVIPMHKHGSFNGVIIPPKDTLDSSPIPGIYPEVVRLKRLASDIGVRERLVSNSYGGLSIGETQVYVHKTGMYIWYPHSISFIRYRRALMLKCHKGETEIRILLQTHFRVKRLWRETHDNLRGVRIFINEGSIEGPPSVEITIERKQGPDTKHTIVLGGGGNATQPA